MVGLVWQNRDGVVNVQVRSAFTRNHCCPAKAGWADSKCRAVNELSPFRACRDLNVGAAGLGGGDGRQWLMNQGRTVFSQLISFLPDRKFRRCVERYQGDIRLRGFSCWDQYLAMAFAQLTYRESLRDIEACLRSMQGKLYDLGFRGKVARATLADANGIA